MTQHVFNYAGLLISTPDCWLDITSTLDKNSPFTLAKEDGVGALQFSIGIYQSGTIPNPTARDLLNMGLEFGSSKHLTSVFDESMVADRIHIGAVSYQWDSNFLRVWYVSDGYSVAFVTYTCDWNDVGAEVAECEDIVQRLSFG